MLSSFLFLLQTAPSDPPPDVPQTVQLTAEQMAQIGAQINGAALWISAFLAVLLVAIGALMYVSLIGGR